MNIALWVIQGLLAVMFTMAGIMKLSQPIEKLSPKLTWVNDFPAVVVRFIGLSELLGAIGLIVPQLTGIAPILTPLAAAGLCIIMVMAALYHLSKGEYKAIVFNTVLFALAAFVAYSRMQA